MDTLSIKDLLTPWIGTDNRKRINKDMNNTTECSLTIQG